MLKNAMLAVTLVMFISVGYSGAQAQDADSPKPAAESQKVLTAYRLDFLLSEMEDGKKINTRQYSMNSSSGDDNSIKIGTRVPVVVNISEPKEQQIQYIDVGVSISCRLRDQSGPGAGTSTLGGNVLLNVRSEVSSMLTPESGRPELPAPVRQVKIEASTIGMPGKPLLVGVVDDPNSKRQYQLEVTVTKLR